MKKILIFLFILLILLGGFMIYNATQLSSRQKLVELGVASPPINVESASRRLAKAVQQYTTSVPGKIDTAAMRGLHRVMKESFPGIDSVLKKDTVNQFSLLYTWPGSDADLKPIVLMSHMDVVPVPEEDLEKWTYPPMSGRIQDDYIWGRGTLDDKVGVMGIMEAVEQLIEEGFVPKRTTYLAFGHDEEIGGRRGAKAIAELLSTRGVKAKFVLDEGMVVTEGVVPGIEVPAPLIGISEKGFATLELTVKGEGGHSSMPPPQTSIGILSKAISEIEANPMPVDLDGPFGTFLTYTAPEMSFGYKMIFGNMWLLKPVIISQLSKSPTTNAAIRTTAATTMIQGGVKDNILPTVATAKVNFRILPGQTIEEVVAHATEVIDDERVNISVVEGAVDPSPISSVREQGYLWIEKSIREVMPGEQEMVVAPSVMIAQTDARHYTEVSQNIYRFCPLRLNADDLKRIHGLNERILVNNYRQAISFYYRLIKNANL